MPFCTKMMPSATWTASAPTTRTISGLNHTAYILPVYASQGELPHRYATLGSGCRHTWPGGTGYPLGSNEKFQRRLPHPNLPGLAWRTQIAFKSDAHGGHKALPYEWEARQCSKCGVLLSSKNPRPVLNAAWYQSWRRKPP